MNQTPSNTSETCSHAPAKMLVWRRLCFGVACLATLVALAYAEENWRGRRAWQAHREEWTAKGEKLALAQLIPPSIADDQNFALCPLLKPVLDLTHGPAGVVWHDTNGMARLNRFAALLFPNGGTNGLLALGSLEKGAFADPASWVKVYRGDTNFPAADDLQPAEAVLTAFSKLEPEVRELREAAASRPYSRFPVHYEEEPPYGVLLPHLAKVKAISTFLEVRATAELVKNRPPEAFEDLRLGLRMSESIREEAPVISHLVRMLTLGQGLQTVREGLLRHAWTDAQLAEIQARLGSVNLLAEYKTSMRGERAASVAELDYLRRNGTWGVNVEDFFGKGSTTCERVLRLAPSGWIYQNMLTLSQICQEYTLPAVDERARRILPDLSNQGMRLLERRSAPYALFPRLFQAGLEKVLQRCGRMQTFVDAARVACALERYKLANGGLPDSLGALAPKYIDQLPHDLIDGQPLRWDPHADGGYVLYSVGWNKTDDGGTLGWNQAEDTGIFGLLKEKQGPWVDPAIGDWVWSMPGR